MKKCVYCGKELPDEASFCPHCSHSLIEKQTPATPIVFGRTQWFIGILAVLITVVILVSALHKRPKTFDDQETAEILYSVNGTTYHVLLRSNVGDPFHWREPEAIYARKIPSNDESFVMPLQLNVFDEATSENASEAFLSLVKSTEVQIESVTDSRLAEVSDPEPNSFFENAALVSEVVYDVECQDNVVTWILHMKNGDTLRLHETMLIEKQPEVFYSYKDTPLETVEDLQALLDQIDKEIGPSTLVNITLAPIPYEGTIHLGTHVVNLIGTIDSDAQTTIHGSMDLVEANSDGIPDGSIQNIRFVGDGSGDGLLLYAPLFITSCSFTNYEYGIRGLDGSWPMSTDVLFENCRYGLYIDSMQSDTGSYWFDNLIFRNNGTGLSLIHMPNNADLYFTNCVYEGNELDIDNQAGNQILDEY